VGVGPRSTQAIAATLASTGGRPVLAVLAVRAARDCAMLARSKIRVIGCRRG
jgi:hypothetical protein